MCCKYRNQCNYTKLTNPLEVIVEHRAVIMKVISDYDYITNVIDYDYDYIASESHDYDNDYDYLRSCNRLQSIMITDYDYPIPDIRTTIDVILSHV